MSFDIRKPVGLETFVNEIQTVCAEEAYRRCGAKPPNYIVTLDAGNGHTMLAEYMAESFAQGRVRHFGGLDMYLEYTVNGSMDQLRKIFADIRASAVYTNHYEGVVALDITRLADHINETQVDYFMEEIRGIAQHATLLFFIPAAYGRKTVSLVGKLKEAVTDIRVIQPAPYSTLEMTEITKVLVEEAGVRLEWDSEVKELVYDLVSDKKITSVREAKKLCQSMIKHADFRGFLPVMGKEQLKGMIKSDENVREEHSYEK